MRRVALSAQLLVAWLAHAGFALAQTPAPAVAVCPPGARSEDLDAARTALDRDEGALGARLQFADALLSKGCYGEAVHILEEGDHIHPRNVGIQSRLRDARSMLSEQRYFDSLGHAEEAAKIERFMLRCKKLGEITACDEALRVKPNDAEIIVAKGDALMQTNRPADAIPVYRQASGLGNSGAGVQEKLAAAESKRQSLLSECQEGRSDSALQACQLALLRGASDEFTVQQRKAVLLQEMGRPIQALESYIAASLLKPDNDAVALAIVELTNSTGRRDAVTLAAKGNSLLTLKRGGEAVKALREAKGMSAGIPDLGMRLAEAEKLARAQTRETKPEPREEEPRKGPVLAAANVPRASNDAAAAQKPPPVEPVPEPKRTYSNQAPAGQSY